MHFRCIGTIGSCTLDASLTSLKFEEKNTWFRNSYVVYWTLNASKASKHNNNNNDNHAKSGEKKIENEKNWIEKAQLWLSGTKVNGLKITCSLRWFKSHCAVIFTLVMMVVVLLLLLLLLATIAVLLVLGVLMLLLLVFVAAGATETVHVYIRYLDGKYIVLFGLQWVSASVMSNIYEPRRSLTALNIFLKHNGDFNWLGFDLYAGCF